MVLRETSKEVGKTFLIKGDDADKDGSIKGLLYAIWSESLVIYIISNNFAKREESKWKLVLGNRNFGRERVGMISL